MSSIEVEPISSPTATSAIDFGAVIRNVDVENLTDDDFRVIHDALYRYQVICIKDQKELSPKAQAELTRRFDPAAQSYGHGKTIDAKRSVLHPDLKTVPHQPEVQIIGHGYVEEYEGVKNARLVHPHHKKFHKTTIPEEEDLDYTRFYRWHIDAALYGLNPPLVTSLYAVSVPTGRRQTVRYDDGTGDELDVPLGTTAFASGYQTYDLLTEDQKTFVRTSKIEYAPHPYVWMSSARSRSDGLGMETEGLEVPWHDLPTIEKSKIQILPMCWRNPITGKLAVQIHPSAIRRIHLQNGDIIDDLETVRNIVHDLQRPGIAPSLVYPHDWEETDLVLFNNHGVLHSVVGAFGDNDFRLFRQCNLAASRPPLGPLPETTA